VSEYLTRTHGCRTLIAERLQHRRFRIIEPPVTFAGVAITWSLIVLFSYEAYVAVDTV
jgi:hypothetical protein